MLKSKITKTKTVSVDLSSESQIFIKEILKRTGEKKVDLFNRLIASEHNRVINGESIPEVMNKKIQEISQSLNDAIPILNKISESSSSSRDGIAKTFVSNLVVLKELIKFMYFMTAAFKETSLLKPEQLSIINNDAIRQATDNFNSLFSLISESKSLAVIEMLKGK